MGPILVRLGALVLVLSSASVLGLWKPGRFFGLNCILTKQDWKCESAWVVCR